MLRYAILRLTFFGFALGGLYLLGLRTWLLVAVAILVAAMLSYIFLPSQRVTAARAVQARAERRVGPTRIEALDAEEDAQIEAALAAHESELVAPGESEQGNAEQSSGDELQEPHAAQDPDQRES